MTPPRDLPPDLAAARRILALDRRAHRAATRLARGRAIALKTALFGPGRALRAARTAVRRYGAATAEASGIGTARQAAWTWWLGVRHRYDSETVYRYRLFTPERAWPTPLFVQPETAGLLYRAVTRRVAPDAARTIADKRRFAEWCRANDIPTAHVLAEFEGGRATRSRLADAGVPAHDLFAKWATAYGGDATRLWRYQDGRFVDEAGEAWELDALVASLAEQSRGGPVVLQPRLVNHPAIRALSPHALSTIRIMTLRAPAGEPRLLAGVLRMATGSATVDNVTQGGWVSAVDPATGALGVARRYDELHRTFDRDTHPDTGAAIRGFVLPFWPEAVELALRAHDRLGPIPCVGWDVAVLPDGPVLIEGNWNPGTKFVQTATQIPLLGADFGRVYAEWLDHASCRFDDRFLAESLRWSPV